MSQFFGGALDPTWPHVWLIAGSILGGVLVGLGVILEAPKILSIPVAAVVVGVIIEAACTLLLFGFDEGISSRQQRDIVVATDRATDAGFDAALANNAAAELYDRAAKAELELAKLKLPRIIKPKDMMALIARFRPYAGSEFWVLTQKGDVDLAGEQISFARQLSEIFSAAGWRKDSHWSRLDKTKATPEFRPISDRGCLIAFAIESAALGKLVVDGLQAAGIECQPLPDNEIKLGRIDIEVGLR